MLSQPFPFQSVGCSPRQRELGKINAVTTVALRPHIARGAGQLLPGLLRDYCHLGDGFVESVSLFLSQSQTISLRGGDMTDVIDDSVDQVKETVPENAWSVTRINNEIEAVLTEAATRFPQYVVGEITDISRYDFATFFDLTDTDGDARISCLAWSSSVAGFEHDLEAGVTAVVQASVDHYPDQGRTQLLVRDYWPVGDSQRVEELEALRMALAEDGAFDEDAKQSLPRYPRRIGVVTSPSGSALEDFKTTVTERWPLASVHLSGASVQGDGAVAELVDAIQSLERDQSIETIVVTRGGGADETLWCFNEEPVVRAISDCTTPVVVAVGHEDDETLAEQVADTRAMTPTAAGVVTTPAVEAFRDDLKIVERRIEDAYTDVVTQRLMRANDRIETALAALEQQAVTREVTRQRVIDLERRVKTAYETLATSRLTELDRRMNEAIGKLEQATVREQASMTAARGRVDDLEARIEQAYIQTVSTQLQTIERRIDTAYREVETGEKLQAGQAEARRLRIIVAVLVTVLFLAVGAVLVLLL